MYEQCVIRQTASTSFEFVFFNSFNQSSLVNEDTHDHTTGMQTLSQVIWLSNVPLKMRLLLMTPHFHSHLIIVDPKHLI